MATTKLRLLRQSWLVSSVSGFSYGARNSLPLLPVLRPMGLASSPRCFLLPCLPARSFCSRAQEEEDMAEINAKFAEAREEIELAMESKETVYFNDEAESARVAVQAVLEKYQGLLDRLPEDQRGAVQRSMGLKMEQLKAEFNQLNE